MFDKAELLKVAEQVREQGVTTTAAKTLMKQASDIRITTLLAAIKK